MEGALQGPYPRLLSGQAGCWSCWHSCRTPWAPSSLSLRSRQVRWGFCSSREAKAGQQAPDSRQLPSLWDRGEQGMRDLSCPWGAAPGGKESILERKEGALARPTAPLPQRLQGAGTMPQPLAQQLHTSITQPLAEGQIQLLQAPVGAQHSGEVLTAGAGDAGIPQPDGNPQKNLRALPSGCPQGHPSLVPQPGRSLPWQSGGQRALEHLPSCQVREMPEGCWGLTAGHAGGSPEPSVPRTGGARRCHPESCPQAPVGPGRAAPPAALPARHSSSGTAGTTAACGREERTGLSTPVPLLTCSPTPRDSTHRR